VFSLEVPTPQTIRERLARHRRSGRPAEKQIDTIYGLNCGVISNMKIDATGRHTASLLPESRCQIFMQREPSLFIFLAMFSVLYNQADMGADFNFLDYSGTELGACVLNPPEPMTLP
jgi:hypothetical protein